MPVNDASRWLVWLVVGTAACSAARNESVDRNLGSADGRDSGDAKQQPDASDADEDASSAEPDAAGDPDESPEDSLDAGGADAAFDALNGNDAEIDAANSIDAAATDANASLQADAHDQADAYSDDAAALMDAAPVDPSPTCSGDPARTFSATLRATCDDRVKIFFNGVLVAAPDTNWNVLHQYEVPLFLYPGRRNTIALEASNLWEQGGFDRGVIAELDYTLNGVRRFVNTDTSWLISTQRIEGFAAPDFDDSAWSPAVSLGKSGIPPWSSVPFNTQAEWLWSYLPSGAPDAKADNETLYLRKSFYMDESGAALDSAPCK